MRLLTLTLLVILIVFSCSEENPEAKYHKGRIEYQITYLNKDMGDISPAFLPQKMILYFNPDYSVNIIEGFMGFFRLNNITYFNNGKCLTYLKVLDKNYLFEGEKHEQMCCFEDMDDMEITHTQDSAMIAGLKCNKAIIKLPQTNETFTIYYTKEIGLRDPNSTNPYKKIDGVLMEFNLQLSYLKMHFKATHFTNQKPGNKNFDIPEDSRVINRDEMSYVLQRLLD